MSGRQSDDIGTRVENGFRRVAVLVMCVAAALFGSVFFFGLFEVLSRGQASILLDWKVVAALSGSGAMTALMAYMAWCFSSNRGMPNWVLWGFGLMMAAGIGIGIFEELRTRPDHFLWWLALLGVVLVLEYVLSKIRKQRLSTPLWFVAWIGGNYFIEGTIAWGAGFFLVVWLGLLAAILIQRNQRTERKDRPV
jgi:hypothetical protein